MPRNNSFVDKLQSTFGFSIERDHDKNVSSIRPAEKDEDGKLKPLKLPSEIQKLWDWFTHNTADTPDTLKNRFSRYGDLAYMFYNDTVCSGAIELYADETVQFDSQSQPLIVNAKEKKVVNYINDFFAKIGINQQSLREIAWNLALYGDSFSINAIKNKVGITSSIVVDVTTILDRIEFNAINVKKQMSYFKGLQTWMNRDSRLKQLADTLKDLKDEDDKTKFYKSYLFGFQVEDNMFLPPWSVTHFRLFSSKSEFYPYGRPLLINSISPFRQLKASKNLMAMARAAKFPKEHFEIKMDETMTEAEQWNAVNEARTEYNNLSVNEGAKEDYAIGGQIWTPMDLVKYNLLENTMKLDDIADIELLREDIIIGTRIPKGYLIVDRASFGASGQALLQQYKPFGRSVLTVQNAILRELIQMVKIQFIISGDYPEETEFELEMNYPIIEDSSDRLSMKTDTLNLAKGIIDNLSAALGINTKLPTEVIRDIFGKYSFLDFADIDKWIKDISAANDKLSEDSNKKLGRLTEKLIYESYFSTKRKLNLREGLMNNKHYMTSYSIDPVNEGVLECLRKGNEKERL